ncbi:MAG: putative endonuclease [Frankiales bacterium]|nr:putative endonuclease [Frankiales bacterium]
MVDEAERFAAFPCVHSRIGDGSWSLEHADAVLDEVAASGLEQDDGARVVDLVVSQQEAVTPHQLRGAVRAAIVLLDLEEACRRVEKVTRDRDVRSWDGKDGSGCALMTGPKPLIAQLMASLDSLIWPKQPGDERLASQRRFDVMMDLVCGRVVPGQWQAQVIVALSTLEGDDSRLAEIPGFGTILPSEARELVAQAGMRRVVVDEHEQLVAVDSTVSRPDLDPHADVPTQPLLSEESEPEPVDELPADVCADDQAWLAQRPPAGPQPSDLGDPCATLDAADADPAQHQPRPTEAEKLWFDSVTDRAEVYADQDKARARRQAARVLLQSGPHTAAALETEPTPDAPTDVGSDLVEDELEDPLAWLTSLRRPSWSARGLRQALQKIRLDKVVLTDLHSDAYAIPKALKRYLTLRDLCCTFPGCARPASQCESDHVTPWPRGSTSAPNLASECKHHHLAKHSYFTVARLPNGTMRWTTPIGASYDRRPRPLLRGW